MSASWGVAASRVASDLSPARSSYVVFIQTPLFARPREGLPLAVRR
jgi:hypothetical protein